MNWDAIAAVAELTAAVGVIVSLAYLARQTRQSNTTDKLSTTLNLQSSYNEVGATFLGNGELMSRGLQDLAALGEADQLKFAITLHLYFGHIELVHSYDRKGMLDQDTVNRTYKALEFYLATPGVQDWWRTAGRNTFSDDFISFVEGRIGTDAAIKHEW